MEFHLRLVNRYCHKCLLLAANSFRWPEIEPCPDHWPCTISSPTLPFSIYLGLTHFNCCLLSCENRKLLHTFGWEMQGPIFRSCVSAMWVKIKNQTLQTLLQSIYCLVASPSTTPNCLFSNGRRFTFYCLRQRAFDTHLSAFILLEVRLCELQRSMSGILKKVRSGHRNNGVE